MIKFFDPAKSKLAQHDLLPEAGMASRADRQKYGCYHPWDARIFGQSGTEKAKELEIPIYSFPEFVALQSSDKQRIVVAGSAGKTTITSMIMHVLQLAGKDFDYLVGAQIPGL